MKKAIGGIFSYNIVIFFLLLVFAFLLGSISYTKAFKVNTRITDYIEKYEGYNAPAQAEINKFLDTLGYERDITRKCPAVSGASLVGGNAGNSNGYCVYEHKIIQTGVDGKNYISYYYYTITTFIYMDIPNLDRLAVPVTSESEHIYNFNHEPI